MKLQTFITWCWWTFKTSLKIANLKPRLFCVKYCYQRGLSDKFEQNLCLIFVTSGFAQKIALILRVETVCIPVSPPPFNRDFSLPHRRKLMTILPELLAERFGPSTFTLHIKSPNENPFSKGAELNRGFDLWMQSRLFKTVLLCCVH